MWWMTMPLATSTHYFISIWLTIDSWPYLVTFSMKPNICRYLLHHLFCKILFDTNFLIPYRYRHWYFSLSQTKEIDKKIWAICDLTTKLYKSSYSIIEVLTKLEAQAIFDSNLSGWVKKKIWALKTSLSLMFFKTFLIFEVFYFPKLCPIYLCIFDAVLISIFW